MKTKKWLRNEIVLLERQRESNTMNNIIKGFEFRDKELSLKKEIKQIKLKVQESIDSTLQNAREDLVEVLETFSTQTEHERDETMLRTVENAEGLLRDLEDKLKNL